ncbi:unnamed protein product [Onchocerca ochengi]|uniref:Uncharacterized protein n=1 Tax=Onchocerca ochengi TaxID=42157 RepID=A0A182E5U4_ONCOC|nr:unnamed protein product [Onchocerca ochengi]
MIRQNFFRNISKAQNIDSIFKEAILSFYFIVNSNDVRNCRLRFILLAAPKMNFNCVITENDKGYRSDELL